jgi:hypothetical protein
VDLCCAHQAVAGLRGRPCRKARADADDCPLDVGRSPRVKT